MKNKARILIFFLVSCYGAFSAMPGIYYEELKQSVYYPDTNPISDEHVPSEANDKLSLEDETFPDMLLISFFRTEVSILFHHIENSRLQGSPKPPYSPPE